MVKWDGVADNIGEIYALKRQVNNDDAQKLLEKVYRYVIPIMKKYKYRVHKLVEFLPEKENLLGLNVNYGQKISLRLRYHHDPTLFLPFESVLGVMLHELCHNTFGPHDEKFFKLLAELTNEMDILLIKGFTGDPFMGNGRTIGRAPLKNKPITLSAGRHAGTAATPIPATSTHTPAGAITKTATKGRVGKGHKLGGQIHKDVVKNVPIRVLALEAAERRRQANELWKQANNQQESLPDECGEIIDLTGDSDDSDDYVQIKSESSGLSNPPKNAPNGADVKQEKDRDTEDDVIYILD